MSKNDCLSPNKEEKSSKLIIISKDRIKSAKNRVNLLTLKEGAQKITVQLNNDSLNENSINQAVKSIKQTLLINSKSNGSFYEHSKVTDYLKKKNILKTPSVQREKKLRKSPYMKKNDNLNIETMRSCNLMKTTENNKYDYEETNINKLETIVPYENDTEENLKSNNNKKTKKEEENDKINNIETMTVEIDVKNNINENNESDNNKPIIGGFVSKDYFNNTKNISKDITEEKFDKYKSEEINQFNSNSSRANNNTNLFLKNSNVIERNNQQSDKAAKSISEQDVNNKVGVVSKLILESVRINETENNKENIKGQRLITEYDEINNKNDENDLISESKSNKTIEVEENDDYEEEEVNKQNNDNNNINDGEENKKINNFMKIKSENNNINKETNNNTESAKFAKLKENFKELKSKENSENLKQINSLPVRSINYIYKTCSICEHASPISKLFVAECQQHYLCRKCAKNYYEDIIENGIKEMLCPFTKCHQPVNLEMLNYIISKEHFNILVNKTKNLEQSHTKFCNTKLKSSYDQENLQLYTKKHVIDINTNKNFFEYNNIKDIYCPNCYTDSLFSKTNTFFFKCLNCGCKRCKYCLKDFGVRHMDTVSPEHCKVYYRFDEEETKDSKTILTLLLQLFFVFATYYLCFVGTFLFMRTIFYYIFCIKKKSNIFLYILAYLFTIIFFLIVIPFIIFFYPYFPSILALSDY